MELGRNLPDLTRYQERSKDARSPPRRSSRWGGTVKGALLIPIQLAIRSKRAQQEVARCRRWMCREVCLYRPPVERILARLRTLSAPSRVSHGAISRP
eukprot:9476826-Pyramimonas_sp.AAC.1